MVSSWIQKAAGRLSGMNVSKVATSKFSAEVLPRLIRLDDETSIEQTSSGSNALAMVDFLQDLKIVFRIGSENLARMVNKEDVDAHELDLQSLLKSAIQNLLAKSDNHLELARNPERTFFGVTLPNELSSSAILFERSWFARFVPWNFLYVTIPYRDALMFGDRRSKEGVAAVRQLSTSMWQEAIPRHRLSEMFFIPTMSPITIWQPVEPDQVLLN